MLISSVSTAASRPAKFAAKAPVRNANVTPLQPKLAPPAKDSVKFGSIALSVGGTPVALADDVETNLLADPLMINMNFPVTAQTMAQFNAMLLDRADKKKDLGGHLKLLINTPGGEVYSGLQTTQLIKRLGVPVDTVIMGGQAASMGSLMFMSGTGRRIMTPDSSLMIHEPAVMGEMHANLTKLKAMAKDMEGMFKRMQRLFAEKTGIPMPKMQELTGKGEDLRLGPLQALKLGFATHVLLDDNKALTQASVAKLSDDEVKARDEENDFSNLKTEDFDPKNVKQQILDIIKQAKSQAAGGGQGMPHARRGGGGGLPPGLAEALARGGALPPGLVPPGFPGGPKGPAHGFPPEEDPHASVSKEPKFILMA